MNRIFVSVVAMVICTVGCAGEGPSLLQAMGDTPATDHVAAIVVDASMEAMESKAFKLLANFGFNEKQFTIDPYEKVPAGKRGYLIASATAPGNEGQQALYSKYTHVPDDRWSEIFVKPRFAYAKSDGIHIFSLTEQRGDYVLAVHQAELVMGPREVAIPMLQTNGRATLKGMSEFNALLKYLSPDAMMYLLQFSDVRRAPGRMTRDEYFNGRSVVATEILRKGDSVTARTILLCQDAAAAQKNQTDLKRVVTDINTRALTSFASPAQLLNQTFEVQGAAVVAAASLPLADIRDAGVTGALESLMTSAGAMDLYMAKDWDNDGKLEWPATLKELHTTNGKVIGLINEDVAAAEGEPASGAKPRHGYCFKLVTLNESKIERGYAIYAYPVEYGKTGKMTYGISRLGVLVESDLGPNTMETIRKTNVIRFRKEDGWLPMNLARHR